MGCPHGFGQAGARQGLCGQGHGAGSHQQVGAREDHEEVVEVLGEAAVAGLDEPKVAFDDQEWNPAGVSMHRHPQAARWTENDWLQS